MALGAPFRERGSMYCSFTSSSGKTVLRYSSKVAPSFSSLGACTLNKISSCHDTVNSAL